MRCAGHDETNHKWTDQKDLVCRTFFISIAMLLFSGVAKSFQGLNALKVTVARGVIKMLENLELSCTNLCKPASFFADLKNKWTRQLENHLKWGFPNHLLLQGGYLCQCISCGLHHKDDPIECPHHRGNVPTDPICCTIIPDDYIAHELGNLDKGPLNDRDPNVGD